MQSGQEVLNKEGMLCSMKDAIKVSMNARGPLDSFLYPKDSRSRVDDLASKYIELNEEVSNLRMQLKAYKLLYSASLRTHAVDA